MRPATSTVFLAQQLDGSWDVGRVGFGTTRFGAVLRREYFGGLGPSIRSFQRASRFSRRRRVPPNIAQGSPGQLFISGSFDVPQTLTSNTNREHGGGRSDRGLHRSPPYPGQGSYS
jgi:hypothetical protein